MVVSNYNKTKEKNKMTEEMKFCSKCGKKILKEAEMCPKCGVRQSTPSSDLLVKGKMNMGIFILLLLFCFPLAIVYYIMKK